MVEHIIVPRRTIKEISEVDGNLTVNSSTVKAIKPDENIIVKGITECVDECVFGSSLTTSELKGNDGEIIIEGNLVVDESIKIRRGGMVVQKSLKTKKMDVDRKVEIMEDMDVDEGNFGGSLQVKGNVMASLLKVGGLVKVGEDAEVQEFDVGGSVKVDGNTKSRIINVGGTFVGGGRVEAEIIDVGGTVKIEDEALVETIEVGGSAKIDGGTINGIRVGGTLKSYKSLLFKEIRVGGSVKLSSGKGEDIDVGGSLKCEGDLTFINIDVGGTVRIDGNASGNSIDVGGTVRTHGNLTLSEDLKVGGKADVIGVLKTRNINAGGKVQARKIEAVDEINANIIITNQGAKAKVIKLGRRGEAEGPLIGINILIRDRGRVDDIYAETVTLRSNCRARNIYANKITLESGCRISGEVKYSDSILTENGVMFSSNPEKIEILPSPPF